jgi:spermidine synthase
MELRHQKITTTKNGQRLVTDRVPFFRLSNRALNLEGELTAQVDSTPWLHTEPIRIRHQQDILI